jgi:fumarate hydratase subunit alpha
MREIDVSTITENLRRMCMQANTVLSDDMRAAIEGASLYETSERGKHILEQLVQNLDISELEYIPICQDTGMAVVFLDIGQDVHFIGGDLTEAINEGVRQGYRAGYLRASVLSDPILRVNSGDNTPAIIHTRIVPGEDVIVTLAPKGFGSENMSKIYMKKPADGEQGIIDAVIDAVRSAGANACPPIVVGVGVGGDFEMCALFAKRALLRRVGNNSPLPHIAALEKKLLQEVNALGIGPAGLGGSTTALNVAIETAPTHIAGLPVAVNICCHVNRHVAEKI